MYKLIFTLVTLAAPPGGTPTATAATSALALNSRELCEKNLAGMAKRGDHSFTAAGVELTIHFAGGQCQYDPVTAPALTGRAHVGGASPGHLPATPDPVPDDEPPYDPYYNPLGPVPGTHGRIPPGGL